MAITSAYPQSSISVSDYRPTSSDSPRSSMSSTRSTQSNTSFAYSSPSSALPRSSAYSQRARSESQPESPEKVGEVDVSNMEREERLEDMESEAKKRRRDYARELSRMMGMQLVRNLGKERAKRAVVLEE